MTCSLAVLAFLLASAPHASDSAESLLKDKLLAPLAAPERARTSYSRAAPPPAEHRLRILDAAPIADGKGGAFVGFAVDARRHSGKGPWHQNAITGCVYLESGEVYVRYGKGYHAARILFGTWSPPAPGHVCRAAEAVDSAAPFGS
jgi:hypothetical protein